MRGYMRLLNCTHNVAIIVINTGLSRLSNLAPVGHTLEKLCLCDQGLTRIENLLLPQLRELLLHQNALTRIENLEGYVPVPHNPPKLTSSYACFSCPNLQKVWLFSNKITRIENLHCLGDVRELWLQVQQSCIIMLTTRQTELLKIQTIPGQ